MRALCVGVLRMTGTGRESQRPYDFAQLLVLREGVPSGPVVEQYGYEVVKLDVSVDVVSQFKGFAWPVELDLTTTTELTARGARTVVIGAKAARAA